eukprot:356925-Chlamydomonas_euryale.AAC.7
MGQLQRILAALGAPPVPQPAAAGNTGDARGRAGGAACPWGSGAGCFVLQSDNAPLPPPLRCSGLAGLCMEGNRSGGRCAWRGTGAGVGVRRHWLAAETGTLPSSCHRLNFPQITLQLPLRLSFSRLPAHHHKRAQRSVPTRHQPAYARAAAHFLSPASLPTSTHARSAQFPPGTDPLALDLLRGLVALDPSERISAADALRHEWFRTPPAPASGGELPRPVRPEALPPVSGRGSQAMGAEAPPPVTGRGLLAGGVNEGRVMEAGAETLNPKPSTVKS